MKKGHVDQRARSPWTPLKGVHSVTVAPGERVIDGEVTIPGSKSLTNRAFIMSALAEGTSTLKGFLRSDDAYWCIDALRKLGVAIDVHEDEARVHGTGQNWKSDSLYIGAAGTVARFLPGSLVTAAQGEWTIEASESMTKRPVAPLIDALRALGGEITHLEKEGHYPLQIKGKPLQGGTVDLSGKISSQYISGLLIAGPYFQTPLQITITDHIVQHAYVRLTLDLMEAFGATVSYDDALQTMNVSPSVYKPQALTLEADASTACYFFGLAALNEGRVRVTNVTAETKQPDIGFLTILEKMGCTVIRGESYVEVQGPKQLKGGFDVSMREMSDQTLTLAALAPFADGPITISEVEHIRYHESNRIKVIAESLTKLGIQVEEYNDGLKVFPGTPKAAKLDTYDDHRVAMSLALIGTKVAGIELTDPGCVSKTCPSFFELLASFGVQVEEKV
ncbi:3-phosphoshikimate 1-carboxyvinyltransferase [Bacillus sp. Marseille-P3800]|uniref:3-phosphoshikimate 1-carboxyvinyltransferase n=1 Tax=Bacillus sp. Marseille-P3800 TaxID=2014782 RepID=UPI000C08DA23|nr:3-phosphoshikimate 1-carboxyvinyltransferase [Bacillus sp. Marseille-P3800]